MPYPAYKDSGIPWLGDVPEHWGSLPGVALFHEKQVKNLGMTEKQVLSLSYGRIVVKPLEKLHGLVPESFETYQVVDPGDIIIRSTDLQNDWTSLRVGIVRDRGIITSAYLRLKTRGTLTPDYGYQLLHAFDLMKVFYGLGSGLRQNLSFLDFKRMPIFFPPLDEQTAIVKFLDYMDRRIRRYIRAKQKLIKLLEEQKRAIIHLAVTRGLDPEVRLKPSGVEWLGDVPEHWGVRRLRNIAEMRVSNVDKLTSDVEHLVRLCNYVDVYKNDRITDQISFMLATATSDEIERFRLKIGDLLITKDSEAWNDIGVPSLVECSAPDLVCGYHLALLRPHRKLLKGGYGLYALQIHSIAYQFHVRANGVTRFGLSQNAIKDVKIPVPPLDEQAAIVRVIDDATANINATISHTKQEISLLGEYRTRLIADVVTGKLDVREAAARLPDEQRESALLDEENTLVIDDEFEYSDADLGSDLEEVEA